MKINYRVFVSFAITLQILMLLFAISAIPAAAVEEPPSSMPLVLQGTVELNGEPAPVNTEITAKVNGDVVGTTEVDQEGIYGSQRGTKLNIKCEPDNYKDIKFYVNGVESQLVDVDILDNAKYGDVLKSVNIIATSPADDSTGVGGSSGGSYSGTTTTSDNSGTDDESSSGSTASASTTSPKSVASTQSTDDFAEEVPASETGSSMMVIVIGAIVLLGIIVTVGYKLKEN